MIHQTVELAVKKDQVSMKCFELKSYFAEIATATFYYGTFYLSPDWWGHTFMAMGISQCPMCIVILCRLKYPPV